MFYERVFRELNKNRVKYLVIGGVALNLHGVPRATADLDLAVEIEKKNLEKIAAVFKKIGFKPRVPVKVENFSNPENLETWHKEKGCMSSPSGIPKNLSRRLIF
jgi:signal recognition particle subunit SEC65